MLDGDKKLNQQAKDAMEKWKIQRKKEQSHQEKHFKKQIKNYNLNKRYKKCCVCGFELVDFAHVKAKKDGGKYTADNIVPLCPNCHRLFDRNRMNKKGIERIDGFIRQTNRNVKDGEFLDGLILDDYSFIKKKLA
jgi:uncharacterized protein with PIN domain